MSSFARFALPLILAAVSTTAWTRASAPAFEDFRVAVQARKPSVKLRLSTAQDKQYRTELATAFRQPVNFAGRYVLSTIGCGASCILAAAIDTKTGTVTWLPNSICCWPPAVVEPLDFQRGSELLIAHGQLNEVGSSGPHYYRLIGGRFAELK